MTYMRESFSRLWMPKTGKRKRRSNTAIKRVLSHCMYMAGEPMACHWCGLIKTYDGLTVDHVVALREGGWHHVKNCVMACRQCNGIRNMEMQSRLGLRTKPTPKISKKVSTMEPAVEPPTDQEKPPSSRIWKQPMTADEFIDHLPDLYAEWLYKAKMLCRYNAAVQGQIFRECANQLKGTVDGWKMKCEDHKSEGEA